MMNSSRTFFTFLNPEGWWYVEATTPEDACRLWRRFVSMAAEMGTAIPHADATPDSFTPTKFTDVAGLPLADMEDGYGYYRGYVNTSPKGAAVEVIVRANSREEAEGVLSEYGRIHYNTGKYVAVLEMKDCCGVVLRGKYSGITFE